jgi:5-methylcytosine-specific restriction endonuclease McrA
MSLLTRYHPGPAPKAPTHPGKRAPLLFKIWYYLRIWTQNYSWKSWYYGKYLKSRAWETKRKAFLTRDKHRCTKCGSYGSLKNPLQVHHADYKRARVGYESIDSPYVFTLCRACHMRHHGRGIWRFLTSR